MPHHDEDESALAEIEEASEARRSRDFEGINLKGTGQREVAFNLELHNLLPTVHVQKNDLLTGEATQDKNMYYPKIISSSFVRKVKRKEVDDIQR